MVLLHQHFHHIAIIVIVISTHHHCKFFLVDTIWKWIALLQRTDKVPEEGRPGLLFLLSLLLCLFGTSTLNFFRDFFYSDVFARLPVDLTGLDLFDIYLSIVWIGWISVILFPELCIREVRILY